MMFTTMKKRIASWFGYWWGAVTLATQNRQHLRHVAGSLAKGINPFGEVKFEFFDPAGNLLRTSTECNLFVTTGRSHIADQMSGKVQSQMSHMAVGTGTTAAAVTDTALQTELDRNPLDSITQGIGVNANKVTYRCTWPAGDGTGALTEAGIFNAASGGVMLNRSVFGVKNKEATEATVMTWTVTY